MGTDAKTALGVAGGVQMDNVVAADGEACLRLAGGNAVHTAVGMRIWAGRCVLVGDVPENFPGVWMHQLAAAGIDMRFVNVQAGFHPDVSEWFFYDADGGRIDLIYASPDTIAVGGLRWPSGLNARTRLQAGEVAALKDAVQCLSARTAAPQPPPHTRLTPEEIAARLSAAGAAHVAPTTYATQLEISRLLAQAGKIVSLDPGHYLRDLPACRLAELLQWVRIFIPSEREVYEYRGLCDLEDAARDFAEMGPHVVVIKVGRRGSIAYDKLQNIVWRCPAFPSRTLDPTGCGDSYCGGFLAGYVERGDVCEAALYGTVSASFTIEEFGATSTLRFTRHDGEARLVRLRREIARRA
jgi:sugar/nucleoside kinase (ribokinase family)